MKGANVNFDAQTVMYTFVIKKAWQQVHGAATASAIASHCTDPRFIFVGGIHFGSLQVVLYPGRAKIAVV